MAVHYSNQKNIRRGKMVWISFTTMMWHDNESLYKLKLELCEIRLSCLYSTSSEGLSSWIHRLIIFLKKECCCSVLLKLCLIYFSVLGFCFLYFLYYWRNFRKPLWTFSRFEMLLMFENSYFRLLNF